MTNTLNCDMLKVIMIFLLLQINLSAPEDIYSHNFVSPRNIHKKIQIGPPFSLYEKQLSKHTSEPDFQIDESLTVSLNPKFFEGDILNSPLTNRRAGSLSKFMKEPLKWPNGIVPYVVESSFDFDERLLIAKAIEEIESVSCVRFVARRKQKDFVYISKGSDCASGVGREGGSQPLTLGRKCLHFGVILHELLHLLGFWHEHSRKDRNKYIKIHWKNIQPKSFNNFLTNPHFKLGRSSLPYDYDSILHYAPYTFSLNPNKPTITPRKKGVTIGQRERLSKMNIEAINRLYRCQGRSIQPFKDEHIDNLFETDCLDMHWSCSVGKAMGMCLFNIKQMSRMCRKTCKICH